MPTNTPNEALIKPADTDTYLNSIGFIRQTFDKIDTALTARAKSIGAVFTSASASVSALKVKGSTNQQAPLQEWRNPDDTLTFASVTAAGGLTADSYTTGPVANDNSIQSLISTRAAGIRGLVVRAFSGQTANIAEFQSSDGVVRSGTTSIGQPFAGTGPTLVNDDFFYSVIRSNNNAAKGLLIRGAAGQAANLAEFQNSAGVITARVSNAGSVASGGVTLYGEADAAVTGLTQFNQPGNPGRTGLVVRGAAGQAANLAEFQNSAGKVQFSVNQFGALRVSGNVATELNEGWASIAISSGEQKGLLVRGAAGQTNNLSEFQNSGGTILAGVNANGLYIFNTVNTQITVGPAGGAAPLPASPTGYLAIVDQNGIGRQIPYYNR